MRFDAEKLRRTIEYQGRTLGEVARAAGLYPTSLNTAVKRGSIRYWTLDKVACRLGAHPSEFEVTE